MNIEISDGWYSRTYRGISNFESTHTHVAFNLEDGRRMTIYTLGTSFNLWLEE